MTNTTEEGRLEAIWIKRFQRGPMDSKDSARAVAGRGLESNANQGGKRQVTILGADRWDEMCHELGESVDPKLRRANLYVRGVDLRDSRGKVLRIGACRVRVYGETRPCHLMDEAWPGLRPALDPDWRGGVYGEVLGDADIAVGDAVAWD